MSKRFIVIVQETHTVDVEAEDEAQIRHWCLTEGAQWIDDHGETIELHDKIISIEEY